jgi:hypothetical protein
MKGYCQQAGLHLRRPKPGDILSSRIVRCLRDYIKRIAAGGQTVEIVNKVVYVDGGRWRDPLMMKNGDPKIYPWCSRSGQFRAALGPEGNVRPRRQPRQQRDSRYWGCVDKAISKESSFHIFLL